MIRMITDPREALTVADIGVRTFTETFGHLYAKADLDQFLTTSHTPDVYTRLIRDEAYAVWLFSRGPVPAGYCVAGPCTLPVPDCPDGAGELARLYILQGHQGEGRGRALLETALDWLGARFDPVYLSVYAENVGAQRLYARYGFRKVHVYHYMVGTHADPEWIMAWKP